MAHKHRDLLNAISKLSNRVQTALSGGTFNFKDLIQGTKHLHTAVVTHLKRLRKERGDPGLITRLKEHERKLSGWHHSLLEMQKKGHREEVQHIITELEILNSLASTTSSKLHDLSVSLGEHKRKQERISGSLFLASPEVKTVPVAIPSGQPLSLEWELRGAPNSFKATIEIFLLQRDSGGKLHKMSPQPLATVRHQGAAGQELVTMPVVRDDGEKVWFGFHFKKSGINKSFGPFILVPIDPPRGGPRRSPHPDRSTPHADPFLGPDDAPTTEETSQPLLPNRRLLPGPTADRTLLGPHPGQKALPSPKSDSRALARTGERGIVPLSEDEYRLALRESGDRTVLPAGDRRALPSPSQPRLTGPTDRRRLLSGPTQPLLPGPHPGQRRLTDSQRIILKFQTSGFLDQPTTPELLFDNIQNETSYKTFLDYVQEDYTTLVRTYELLVTRGLLSDSGPFADRFAKLRNAYPALLTAAYDINKLAKTWIAEYGLDPTQPVSRQQGWNSNSKKMMRAGLRDFQQFVKSFLKEIVSISNHFNDIITSSQRS